MAFLWKPAPTFRALERSVPGMHSFVTNLKPEQNSEKLIADLQTTRETLLTKWCFNVNVLLHSKHL